MSRLRWGRWFVAGGGVVGGRRRIRGLGRSRLVSDCVCSLALQAQSLGEEARRTWIGLCSSFFLKMRFTSGAKMSAPPRQ